MRPKGWIENRNQLFFAGEYVQNHKQKVKSGIQNRSSSSWKAVGALEILELVEEIMGKQFKKPKFQNGILELRIEDNEVCIYATKLGLQKLSEFCQRLIKDPKTGHIHLEDYEVLTPDSHKGVIAIFSGEDEP